jgi:hypothetical protein
MGSGETESPHTRTGANAMQTETLFISRKQHDWLMTNHEELFLSLYAGKKNARKWNLAGVTISGLPVGTTATVVKTLNQM